MARLRGTLYVVLAFGILFIGCSDDHPVGAPASRERIGDKRSAGGPRLGSGGQEYYVTRSTQLDSVLDKRLPPVLASGDTILLAASTTFSLGDKVYPPVFDQSLHIIGEFPKPTISSTYDDIDTSYTIKWQDNANDEQFVIRNVIIDRSSTTTTNRFLGAFGYESFLMEGIEGDLGQGHIYASATHDTFRNCDMESGNFSIHAAPLDDDSDIFMDELTIELNSGGLGSACTYVDFDNKAATLVVEDCTFTGPANDYFLHTYARNDASGGPIISVSFEDVIYDDLSALMDGVAGTSNTVRYEVYWVVEDEECYDPTIFIEGGDASVSLNWEWSGYHLSWDYLGAIENVIHTKKYCNGEDWIAAAFQLVGDYEDEFHENVTPVVKYGFHSSLRPNTALVCWNPSINKWVAEMDMETYADSCSTKKCPVWWDATLTICDSTGTSARQYYEYVEDAGTCKDPLFCAE